MDCTIREAKTKALISFTVTAKLICVFVFAYAKSRFSHDEAQMMSNAPVEDSMVLVVSKCLYSIDVNVVLKKTFGIIYQIVVFQFSFHI